MELEQSSAREAKELAALDQLVERGLLAPEKAAKLKSWSMTYHAALRDIFTAPVESIEDSRSRYRKLRELGNARLKAQLQLFDGDVGALDRFIRLRAAAEANRLSGIDGQGNPTRPGESSPIVTRSNKKLWERESTQYDHLFD